MQATAKRNTITIDVGMKNLAILLFEHNEIVNTFSDIRVVLAGVYDISATSVHVRIQNLIQILDHYLATANALPLVYVEQ